jgi:hypothetical protein
VRSSIYCNLNLYIQRHLASTKFILNDPVKSFDLETPAWIRSGALTQALEVSGRPEARSASIQWLKRRKETIQRQKVKRSSAEVNKIVSVAPFPELHVGILEYVIVVANAEPVVSYLISTLKQGFLIDNWY